MNTEHDVRIKNESGEWQPVPVAIVTGDSNQTPVAQPPPEDRGPWFQTHSGIRFHHACPSVDEVSIDDIAQGLSQLCRFCGQTASFYSVAQHSLFVADLVADRTMDYFELMQALLHDATEAYMADIPKPLKSVLPEYKALEQRLWGVIARRFGIPEEMSPLVKKADVIALMTERRDLMCHPPAAWDIDEARVKPAKYPVMINRPMAEVREEFKERFLEYKEGILAEGSIAAADNGGDVGQSAH